MKKTIAFCCRSLEAAVAAYEKAGGSANIFINDDGLQLLSPEAQLQRIRFYRQHNIGCVALHHRFESFKSMPRHPMLHSKANGLSPVLSAS